MYRDSKRRSIIKAISWRIIASMATVGLVYAVFSYTQNVKAAFVVGGIEVFLKMMLYFFHERIWSKVRFGKQEITPKVLWFTGLSGAGKTTLADSVHTALLKKGLRCQRLDGDILRDFFPNTGFSKEERNAHVQRAGFLAGLLERNGVFVIAALISPYADGRKKVRESCRNFVEIFLSTPIEECERRDVKGLYAKARTGEISHFTGISDPYEPPVNPDLEINTRDHSIEEATEIVLKHLKL